KISSSGQLLVVERPRRAEVQTRPALRPLLHRVTGTVTSAEDGAPLPGVNVVVKNTAIGAATDLTGQFALDAPSLTDTLIFSFVGFEYQEVPIEGRTVVDVVLQPDLEVLDEVVVVGYGEKTRTLLTESV